MSALAQRAFAATRQRAIRSGRPPRRAGQHYFIESEGLHSRIHLQNFYSTFWPHVDAPASARVQVYGPDGELVGTERFEVPRFGSLFLEMHNLLRQLGSGVREGTVAIDLEPPEGIRPEFRDLPAPESVELASPFWMAYYDGAENYMYVHSIDKLAGKIFGSTKPVAWNLTRHVPLGGRWRSWRLLDVEQLSELQIVLVNHRPTEGGTQVGVYSPDDGVALFERELSFRPRQVHRVRISPEEIRAWPLRHPEIEHARVGVEPLLTPNGKPYVLMRYGGGPLSLHHG
jgi:hypothetical protein